MPAPEAKSAFSAARTRFSYAYDVAGNLMQRTYPGSVATSYSYDTDNRLAKAVDASLTTSYGYDVAGNPASTTLPSANGYVESRVYHRSGRLTELARINVMIAAALLPVPVPWP